MVDDQKIYDSLCTLINERTKNTFDAFKQFINLYSAIVGGTIWLSLQTTAAVPRSYGLLSGGAVALLAILTTVLVVEAKRGWWGYRKAQSELAGIGADGKPRIRPPTLFPTLLTEGAMIACILVTSSLFIAFNPLNRP